MQALGHIFGNSLKIFPVFDQTQVYSLMLDSNQLWPDTPIDQLGW